jgi:hypothetical protein
VTASHRVSADVRHHTLGQAPKYFTVRKWYPVSRLADRLGAQSATYTEVQYRPGQMVQSLCSVYPDEKFCMPFEQRSTHAKETGRTHAPFSLVTDTIYIWTGKTRKKPNLLCLSFLFGR